MLSLTPPKPQAPSMPLILFGEILQHVQVYIYVHVHIIPSLLFTLAVILMGWSLIKNCSLLVVNLTVVSDSSNPALSMSIYIVFRWRKSRG